jgi:hypothetical protein
VVCNLPASMFEGGRMPFLRLGLYRPFQLPPPTPADTKRRTLVICPGRLFAFDQWHLFVVENFIAFCDRKKIVLQIYYKKMYYKCITIVYKMYFYYKKNHFRT